MNSAPQFISSPTPLPRWSPVINDTSSFESNHFHCEDLSSDAGEFIAGRTTSSPSGRVPNKFALIIVTTLIAGSLFVVTIATVFNGSLLCSPELFVDALPDVKDARDTINNKLTIVMLTYRRIEALMQNPTFPELVSLDIVDKLILVWNDIETKVPQELNDRFNYYNISHKIWT